MAKDKVETTEEAPVSDRQKRWESYLANYAQKNPVKYASKLANGEFKEIPPSFK